MEVSQFNDTGWGTPIPTKQSMTPSDQRDARGDVVKHRRAGAARRTTVRRPRGGGERRRRVHRHSQRRRKHAVGGELSKRGRLRALEPPKRRPRPDVSHGRALEGPPEWLSIRTRPG